MDVSRRRFVKLGAAGAAGLVAGCRPFSIREGWFRSKGPYWPYMMGVQSYCFRNFTFIQAIEKTRELDLDFIEMFPGHLNYQSDAKQKAAAKAKLAECNVKTNAYGVCGDGALKDRKLWDFCKEFGIGVLSAHASKGTFATLDKLVAEYDIKVALHNHGPGSMWATADQMVKAIGDHDERIGVCLDNGHLARAGDEPVSAIRKIGKRLHGMHLKDVDKDNKDVVVGTGRTDLAGLFKALKDVDFDGALSMEYELDADDPVPGLRRSLAGVRKVLGT